MSTKECRHSHGGGVSGEGNEDWPPSTPLQRTTKFATPVRIGYWISEKKSRKFNQIEFVSICRSYGLEPIQLDLSRPVEEQGPFTLILHKLTDVIAKANCGDSQSQDIIAQFKNYLLGHPEVVVVDPLENILNLLDRRQTYNLIGCSPLNQEEELLCNPAFVELTTNDEKENASRLRSAGVNFPIICKPTVAHGSSLAHQMALIFHEGGLKDVNPPCVAQAFVNHDAVLYKLYVVGEKWFTIERPSLKNFYAGNHETIFFDSHSVSKADSDSSLNKLDEEDMGRPLLRPSEENLAKIVRTVRETLRMGLFGVDVVIDNRMGRYSIVDINAFPGYDGVPEFPQVLIQYMVDLIQMQQQRRRTPSSSSSSSSVQQPHLPPLPLLHSDERRANEEEEEEGRDQVKMASVTSSMASTSLDTSPADDSGIDTGDSSDEKSKLNKNRTVIRRFHSHSSSWSSSAKGFTTSSSLPPLLPATAPSASS